MKQFALVACLLVLGSILWAQTDARQLLKKVDSMASFPDSDFSSEYTFAENKPGEGVDYTDAVVFRRDSEDKYLILILAPDTDRGKGYLKIGDNLWFYDPIPRKYVFTSSKDRFRNSNARNSDFTRSTFASDYDVSNASQEKLGVFDCTVLQLKANNNEVTFPFVKLWISADSLVRKTEDYSLSGQLLRTLLIPTYQGIGDRFVPRTIVIIDNLKGKTIDGKFVGDRTQITISKPSLAKLPDNLFTKAYLEKVSR
jgi:outer membrane lipoprotein-sorting protein